jgi:type IV pilus assembly protein PilB
MFSPNQLKKILVSTKTIKEADFNRFLDEAKKREMPLEQYLLSKKVIDTVSLYKKAASFYKIPFVELKGKIVPGEVLNLIPEVIAQAHQVVAFGKEKDKLQLACLDPEDLQIFEFIHRKTGLEVKLHLTRPSHIKEILNQYRKSLEARVKEIVRVEEAKAAPVKAEELKRLAQRIPVIKIVDTIFEYASIQDASDIHIEPGEKEVIVRYRIDGVLRDVISFPRGVHPGIVARIKVLSDLKLDEHRLPQDGRFKVKILDEDISFRVSVLPTYWGEKIVLRLLKQASLLLTLEQLGFEPEALKVISRSIKKPHGIILVTGPTGCGKTTTLYTMINILNAPGVNICTIEDPIEYQVARLNQSQVQPGVEYTFARGLRALMRQDPDIIMVGEIRDTETADIAINAAMTGHLVLTTFHTNDALTALIRLIDMGVPPFLIASTVSIVIAQRLVRRLCSNCKEAYTLGKKETDELKRELGEEIFNKTFAKDEKIKLHRAAGCKQCGGDGYKGRFGIFESLEANDEISKLIIRRASLEEFRALTKKQGMVTLLEDGLAKAKKGVTSIEEILRATRE